MKTVALSLLCVALTAASTSLGVPLRLNPVHKAKYSDGVKKQNAGEYLTALASFESIPLPERSYDTRLHIASCKARLDRLLDAVADLDDIIAVATKDKLSPTDRDAIVDTAKSDRDGLLAEMPRLSITSNANLAVTLDDQLLTPPVDRAVDPGKHVVIAKQGEKEVFRREVDVARQAKMKIAVEVEVKSPDPVVPPPPKPIAPPATISPGPPTAAYLVLGAGIAFGAVAVGGFVLRGTAINEYRDSCDTRAGCDADLRSPVRRWETIAFTSTALAAVSAGVSVYLFARPRSSVAVSLDATSVRVFGTF